MLVESIPTQNQLMMNMLPDYGWARDKGRVRCDLMSMARRMWLQQRLGDQSDDKKDDDDDDDEERMMLRFNSVTKFTSIE